jgi:hypothetical protein
MVSPQKRGTENGVEGGLQPKPECFRKHKGSENMIERSRIGMPHSQRPDPGRTDLSLATRLVLSDTHPRNKFSVSGHDLWFFKFYLVDRNTFEDPDNAH